jgi:adenylosuccinate synthase
MNILKQADNIVNERSEENERMYGNFDHSMDKTAEIFNSMTGLRLTAVEAFKMLIALKLARESYCHKEDNLLDAVAYIGALNNYINAKSL